MQSMTGFATETGETEGVAWSWEAKSVNGRGLDLRFRLADGFEGLESGLRAIASKRLSRGNVTLNLRTERARGTGGLSLNTASLEAAVAAARQAEDMAEKAGLTIAPSTAAQIINVRGVLEPGGGGDMPETVSTAVGDAFARVIAALAESRAAEGARVRDTFSRIVDEIETLTRAAAAAHAAREDGARARIREKVALLLETEAEIAPERLAQELALIAVKADVSEELERLHTHVAAARDLLASKGPVGRKLDFLTQEFNREANTLCSKSNSADLTQIGLDLKVAIDQMREQAQNVE